MPLSVECTGASWNWDLIYLVVAGHYLATMDHGKVGRSQTMDKGIPPGEIK
jgi:hypothetical protein